ncbi:MAG: septum site-determining protein MinC, partial [Lachnospiraceae bacterium]|nr:septum site-determining protein MinC [Lachnospiraceae bacterium]
MDNSVVIKGSRNGIIVVLDGQVEFGILKDMVAKKFSDSSKFLGNCKTAVRFEGRDLTREEELALLDVIGSNSDLEVVCILSDDPQQSSSFTQAVNKSLMDAAGN